MNDPLLPCPKILPLKIAFKIKFVGDCWIWTGAKNNRGYGHLGINGKNILAHRFTYAFQYGGVPEGMTIDHICRNKLCVNPYHLRVMTQKDNNLCGLSPAAINKRKNTCVNGHPLEGPHVRIKVRKDGTRRVCYLCQAIYKKKAYMLKKGKL